MKTWSSPRRMQVVSSQRTSSWSLDVMTRAWGAKARDRRRSLGPIFFGPLLVKGIFCALTDEAAFYFRRQFQRLFRPSAPAPHLRRRPRLAARHRAARRGLDRRCRRGADGNAAVCWCEARGSAGLKKLGGGTVATSPSAILIGMSGRRSAALRGAPLRQGTPACWSRRHRRQRAVSAGGGVRPG